MKANQLATLVLRLLGIYCLIVFIPFVSVFDSAIYYVGSAHDTSGLAAIIIALIALAFWLGVGILLIVYSVPLGGKLAKDFGESNFTSLSFEQIQVLAFAIAGILIFAGALPQLFNGIYSFLIFLTQLAHRDQYLTGTKFDEWHTLLVAAGIFLKAGLGLCLFFGAHGFANFWRSMRNFGTPKPPQA
jgi:hypothetical protein